jgi:hypothetical protein
MLRLIVLVHLLSGLMMSPYLAHIHITSQTFTVSNLPGGFMSGLIRSCIICVTKTGETLLNGPTSHSKNIRHIFFKPKVLFSCPQKVLYNTTCITNIVPPSPTIPGTIGPHPSRPLRSPRQGVMRVPPTPATPSLPNLEPSSMRCRVSTRTVASRRRCTGHFAKLTPFFSQPRIIAPSCRRPHHLAGHETPPL